MAETEQQLEEILDKHGLDYLLSALARVCSEKAEHVREVWQDEEMAKRWDRICRWAERQQGIKAVRECPLP